MTFITRIIDILFFPIRLLYSLIQWFVSLIRSSSVEKETEKSEETIVETKTDKKKNKSKSKTIKPIIKQNNNIQNKTWNSKHELFYALIKGFTNDATCFAWSPDGKYCACGSRDHTIRVYEISELNNQNPKYIRFNIDYDYAQKIGFSNDSKFVICALNNNSKIQVYEFDSKTLTLFTEYNIDRFGGMNIFNIIGEGSNTMILYTCIEKDLFIRIYSLSGALLAKYNTSQVQIYHGHLSTVNNHNYFAVGTFGSELPIYEINCNKNNEFQKFNKLFSIRGTKTGIFDVDFNKKNLCAFITKDNYLFFYTMNIKYDIHEEPKKISSILLDTIQPKHLFLYPNNYGCIFVNNRDIHIMDTRTQQIIQTITDISPDEIHDIQVHPESKYISILTESDKYIRIFKLPEIEDNDMF